MRSLFVAAGLPTYTGILTLWVQISATEEQDMPDPAQLDDQQDDFVAEVSDLRPSANALPAERPAPFLSPAHRTPRQRLTRIAVIVTAPLLVLVVVLGANPALRAG